MVSFRLLLEELVPLQDKLPDCFPSFSVSGCPCCGSPGLFLRARFSTALAVASAGCMGEGLMSDMLASLDGISDDSQVLVLPISVFEDSWAASLVVCTTGSCISSLAFPICADEKSHAVIYMKDHLV